MRHLTWAAAMLLAFAAGWYLGGRGLGSDLSTGSAEHHPPRGSLGSSGGGSLSVESAVGLEVRDQARTTSALIEHAALLRRSWQHELERLEVLTRGGDREAAITLRQALLRAVFDLGRGGEAAAARELLDAYLARNPHDPQAYLLDSDLKQMQGRPDDAVRSLLELLSFADDPAVVDEARDKLRLLINVQETQLANSGDQGALIRMFEDLTVRDPGFDGHRLRLAHWLLRAGRLAEAERILAETGSVGADPENLERLTRELRLARTGLPLERDGGALHVSAQVSGRPLRMLVDTGATMTAISRERAAVLGATSTGERVRVRTAGGVVESEVHRVRDVEVGGLHLDSLTVLVFDAPLPRDVDGLLGMDVLTHFQSLPGTALPLPEAP